MSETFDTRTIEESLGTLIDYRGKTPPKTERGVRLVTAKVIKDGYIQDDKKEFIAEDFYDEWMRRGLPKQWDIVITTEAPLGEVAQLRTAEKVALAQRVILLRANPDVYDQSFFFQALKGDYVQGRLKARGTGTTVLGIKQSELRKVKVPWFPLPTQRKIASILSAYDDLIENNTRRIAILEEMAQAIYREWFVNFRFPGHENVKLVDSSLGPIPEGWESTRLEEVADVNARSIKKGLAPESINYIDIKSVSTGRIEEVREMSFADAPSRARRVVQHGDVIWSTVRPNLKSYSVVLSPSQNTIASTGFAVLSPKEVPFSYLYFALTTDEFASYLVNHATGAAYPAVNAQDFKNAELLRPSDMLLDQFQEIASEMLVLGQRLLVKNENLRTTRDLLLPKLISGELDVEDLDIDVGMTSEVTEEAAA